MYEAFFHLQSRPFAPAPTAEAYFPADVIEHARQTLIRIVDRAEGPGIVMGPVGVGKSLLLRLVADHFREVFRPVILSGARIATRKALLQNILFELDLPYLNLEEGELRLSLLDFLRPSDSCPHGLLFLVDEAHTLPTRLLDEIRMITNLVRDGQPRVRLILSGLSELEERFANPKLESFNQRIAARCYLDSLSHDETIQYVRSQIAAVGGNSEAIFSHDALVAVYRATDGIPRLINQVCDHALVMASVGGRWSLDAAGIEEAWADLQQLPGPWQDASQQDQGTSVIEFGELDDDNSDAEFENETQEPAADAPAYYEEEVDEGESIELAFPTPPAASTEADTDPATEGESHIAFPRNGHTFDLGWQGLTDSVGQPEVESISQTEREPEPAVEEAAPGCTDPFGDEFEQEEVVVDRYAALEAEVFAGRPRVTSPAGCELSELLASSNQSVDDEVEARVVISPDPAPEPAPERPPARPGPTNDANVVETEPDPTPAVPAFDPLHAAGGDTFQIPVSSDASPMFEYTVFEGLEERDLEPVPANPSTVDSVDELDESEVEFLNCVQDQADQIREVLAEEPQTAPDDEHELRFLPITPITQSNGIARDDRDLIIVEPDEGSPAIVPHPVGAQDGARRVDYHQLFAQLRQS